MPGNKITIEEADRYLGSLDHAPVKIQKWLKRMKALMKEMLEVDFYHFAIGPETREFTDDNISMSVKASQKAIESAGIKARLQGEGDGFRDFVIRHEYDRGLPGFVNLVGIDSPGLTSSPAIARYVSRLVDEILGSAK